MKKRNTLLAALVLCLISLLAGSSLAYFTAKDSVTNEFMVASYDPENPDTDPNTLFSIDVYETNAQGEKEDVGLTYENIAPGDALPKDPTIKNTGKYDAWVRMSLTFSNASSWKTACANVEIAELTEIFDNVSGDWECLETQNDEEKDEITYVYYMKEKLAPGASAVLFDGVTVPVEFTLNEMLNLDSFTLKVSGDAIQEKNTADDAPEDVNKAYYAFSNFWNPAAAN